MNSVQISGKVFHKRLSQSGASGSFSLMFKFDKENQKGEFVKVKFFKDAVQKMEDINEKEFVDIVGWLIHDKWETREGKKINDVVVGTTNIEKKTFDNVEKDHNAVPQNQTAMDDSSDIPF